jgi:hypothetical protein
MAPSAGTQNVGPSGSSVGPSLQLSRWVPQRCARRDTWNGERGGDAEDLQKDCDPPPHLRSRGRSGRPVKPLSHADLQAPALPTRQLTRQSAIKAECDHSIARNLTHHHGGGRMRDMDAEALYLQLGQLVADMPDLRASAPLPPETLRWLGRVSHLVTATSDGVPSGDSVIFDTASNFLGGVSRESSAQQIEAIVYRALAKAEANAPAAARGAFIPAGAGFTALQSVGKVMQEAATDVLIVDPYLDVKAITDFVPLAAEHVTVRLLGDSFGTKPDLLRPAAQRWVDQYATTRPLEIRLTKPRALHDRLILIDRKTAYILTQSLKDLAGRSPASVNRADPEATQLKIDHYEAEWNAATAL